MQKNIQPVAGLTGTATQVSVSDLRLLETTINYQLAFLDAQGNQLAVMRCDLTPEQYADWCESSVSDSNEGFILDAVVEDRDLTLLP